MLARWLLAERSLTSDHVLMSSLFCSFPSFPFHRMSIFSVPIRFASTSTCSTFPYSCFATTSNSVAFMLKGLCPFKKGTAPGPAFNSFTIDRRCIFARLLLKTFQPPQVLTRRSHVIASSLRFEVLPYRTYPSITVAIASI